MASGHASRQWLEAFKFTVYVVTPIAATVYLGTGAYPYLERIIHNVSGVKLMLLMCNCELGGIHKLKCDDDLVPLHK